jgi:hypothetical protein
VAGTLAWDVGRSSGISVVGEGGEEVSLRDLHRVTRNEVKARI